MASSTFRFSVDWRGFYLTVLIESSGTSTLGASFFSVEEVGRDNGPPRCLSVFSSHGEGGQNLTGKAH